MKQALVTAIAGQDGSYLAELLFSKGYDLELARREQMLMQAREGQTHL